MDQLEVNIVTLPPMRVISFNGFGPSPEGQAWEKVISWAKARGLWDGRKDRRFFGFNNPDPTPGSPNYGYDVWMTVEETVQIDGDAHLIEFPGGLYASTRVSAGPNGEGIYDTWQALAAWVEHSKYTPEYIQRECLEESFYPYLPTEIGFTLDLYEPIRV